jgi:hypothetical protein
VVTVHDLFGEAAGAPDSGRTPPARARQPGGGYFKNLARAAHLVCVSEMTCQEVLEYVDIDSTCVSVIPNGFDRRFTRLPDEQIERRRDGLPSATWRVFHLSSTD